MLRATLLGLSVLLLSTDILAATTTQAPTTPTAATEATTPKPDDRYKHAENHMFKDFLKPKEKVPFKEFTFVQAADPQLGLTEWWAHGESQINNTWEAEKESLRNAVIEWNNLKPTFVVINGDLVNAFPNKEENPLREQQMKDLIAELDNLHKDIPLVLLPGNHDINNVPDAASVKQYNDQFGDDYFSFYVNDVKFIVLNTQYLWKDKDKKNAFAQAQKQDQWLNDELVEASKGKYEHTIVLQHMPWFLESIDEVTDKNNSWAKVSKEVAKPILEKLVANGVEHIFAGHYHKYLESTYIGAKGNITQHITTAIGWQGDDKAMPGYNIVTVHNDTLIVERHIIKAPEVPTTTTAKPTGGASSLVACSAFFLINLMVVLFAKL